MRFLLGAFPRSKITFESRFLIQWFIITNLNLFLERLGQYLKNGKMDFPLYFQKVIWAGGGEGQFLLTIFFSAKAKHPGICPSFGGNVDKTLFRHRPIPPPLFPPIQYRLYSGRGKLGVGRSRSKTWTDSCNWTVQCFMRLEGWPSIGVPPPLHPVCKKVTKHKTRPCYKLNIARSQKADLELTYVFCLFFSCFCFCWFSGCCSFCFGLNHKTPPFLCIQIHRNIPVSSVCQY